MGDYLLDLRPPPRRRSQAAAERLRFADDTKVRVIEEPLFGLVVTHTGDSDLWSPFLAEDGTLVAIAGRAAFDESEWESVDGDAVKGGLAAKIIYRRFLQSGVNGLEQINGNCVVLVYDATQKVFHLVTDCSGVFPSFQCIATEGPIYGSHPDVLAEAADECHRLDEVSMAEFVLSSTVTPPFTYYERIRAVDQGTRISIQLKQRGPEVPVQHRYFNFEYRGRPDQSEQELADELAHTIRKAVRRRTLPRLGTSALALSGGLDSRVLLACVESKERTFAFTCYNEPNQELRIAESIAGTLAVRFVPLQRSFDYYGDNAEQGVRISGGMGSFANNHFLGMMDRLRAEGMQNLLTGCYCDYLFKGLPLNRSSHWLTGREQLAPFRHEFYFGHHLPATPLAARVRERWESRIPVEIQEQDTPSKVFQVEYRRTFPLCYEGDNQQRVVPQRVTGWYLPIADREILDLYCRIPYQYKLNRSIFLKTMLALGDTRITRIVDANTGARPCASAVTERVASVLLRARRKLWHHRSIRTDGSWPDWHYYIMNSRKVAALWHRYNPEAMDFFRRVMGQEEVSHDVEAYRGDRLFLFVSLLSMKLWLDQRR